MIAFIKDQRSVHGVGLAQHSDFCYGVRASRNRVLEVTGQASASKIAPNPGPVGAVDERPVDAPGKSRSQSLSISLARHGWLFLVPSIS